MSAGDLSKWSSLSNLNTPRYLHACSQVLLDAKTEEVGVIVSGGYSESYLNTTEIFYPSENRQVWNIARVFGVAGVALLLVFNVFAAIVLKSFKLTRFIYFSFHQHLFRHLLSNNY